MPAARVRLLEVDSATRAAFARDGITDTLPEAVILAAPYGAQCQDIPWGDTAAWVQKGDVGFARATLQARERWIGGVPLLVIHDVWSYPYPRRRGLVFDIPHEIPVAPAEALYGLTMLLEKRYVERNPDALRTTTLAWARANTKAAELPPVSALVKSAVLGPAWPELERTRSRLRGTYRVTMREVDKAAAVWYFRTDDRPGAPWVDLEASRTMAELLAMPYPTGYRLIGAAATNRDGLPGPSASAADRKTVWLAAADQPTIPGNNDRRELHAMLEFPLSSVHQSLWDQLEPFVPTEGAMEEIFKRVGLVLPRSDRQPEFPITLQIDSAGGVRADTMLTSGGRTLRFTLERLDTTSVRKPD